MMGKNNHPFLPGLEPPSSRRVVPRNLFDNAQFYPVPEFAARCEEALSSMGIPVPRGFVRAALELALRKNSQPSSELDELLADEIVFEYISDKNVQASFSSDPENPKDLEAMLAMVLVGRLPENALSGISMPTRKLTRFGDEGLTVGDIVNSINDQLSGRHGFMLPEYVLRVAVECPARTMAISEICCRMCKILRNPKLMLFLRQSDFTLTERVWENRAQISQLLQERGD